MRQFFRVFFATALGAILGVVIIIFLIVGIFVASASKSISSTKYEKENVLLLRNVVTVGEISTPETPSFLSTVDSESELGLVDMIRTLETAADDEKISGIVLDDVVLNAGYATIWELADALQNFKKSGKFVVGHFNTLSQKTYLLASVCDEISMNAEGMAEFHGISSTSIHYKNLLEKIGLKPVMIRCGKYKSYVESVTENKMSEANKEQKQAYINAIWKTYCAAIQKYREVNGSQLNSFADSVLVCLPTELRAFGFIDKIQHADEFWNSVKTRMNIDLNKSVPTVSFRAYMDDCAEQEAADTSYAHNIAVVIAQGSIDMGKSDEESIGSETYVSLFKKIRKDSTVKSVIFRINSGGGSALASELIWREVALTAQEKPVIVSMGDMAASGAYYIAAPGAKIIASPMTLTGSIGVFGLSMTANGLLNKIGVNVDKVNTHPHSDFGNVSRDIDAVEMRAIEKSIDKTYLTFKQRVSEGRNLSVDFVEEIAQGRVWSGVDGLRIGLVDTLGGLNAALQEAIRLAEFSDEQEFGIQVYPKPKTLFDVVTEKLDFQSSFVDKLVQDEELKTLLKNVPMKSGVYTQIQESMTIE